MWLEQGFVVGDLTKWIKEETLLTVKFTSVIDGSEFLICFAEKDSLVLMPY